MLRYLLSVCLALSTSACIPTYGISEFGPLKRGEKAPFGPGDPTSYPYKRVPVSKFYVYLVARQVPTMCIFEECGVNGDLVQRMGGWITGDGQAESIDMVGLDEVKVRRGEQSMIVVADKTSKIIGIYPNHTMQDLPVILRRHPELGKVPR